MRKRGIGLLVAAAGLLLTACFDISQPVEERLKLRFLADGSLHLQLLVELRHRDSDRRQTAVARRLRQLQEDLLEGSDPWARRFAEAPAAIESFFWEKEAGRLVAAERNLVLDRPADLAAVLAETPIHATFLQEDGFAELALYPGLPDRATRRQRREMERTVEGWSRAIEAYLAAAEGLYRHLERQPHRAVPCFGAIFADDGEYGELTEDEDALIEAFAEASGEIIGVLDVDHDRGYSLEELSRRVFDPFPALFEVELASEPLEVEGFAPRAGRWTVPGLSLWASLAALEGKWLSPDPVVAWVEHMRFVGDEAPFDVVGFADKPRRVVVVDQREIQDELDEHLQPADVYRLKWALNLEDAAPNSN